MPSLSPGARRYTNTLLSRLDDRITGAIVIVMQRVHMENLVGHVTRRSEEWTILKLPAIATDDQLIATGPGRSYLYRANEVLHPAREPLCRCWTPTAPSWVLTRLEHVAKKWIPVLRTKTCATKNLEHAF